MLISFFRCAQSLFLVAAVVTAVSCAPAALDPSVDHDGDGWSYNDGDLDDSNRLVNPGAFEVPGNGIDDDCDPATSDTVPAPDGAAAAVFTGVDPLPLAAAMGVSRTTTLNPALRDKTWGLISAEFLAADGSTPNATQLSNMRNYQAAILLDYGTGGVSPRSGSIMAGLSTGHMRDESDPDYTAPANGTNFSTYGAPPAAFLAAHGGSLPAGMSCGGSCLTGSGANDSINLRLTIRVPTNAASFSFDFAFFSAEYKNYTCTKYNDYFLTLLTSGAAGLPADRNICFDTNGNCVTVNSGLFTFCAPKTCYTCPNGTGILAGTGMETTGGATGWVTAAAPVVPGEVITLDFMIFDVDDCILDSVVLIDNFRWDTP